jgi:peptidoglycan-associated lipoprotein
MKQLFVALGVSLLLVGCGSAVKNEEKPPVVESKPVAQPKAPEPVKKAEPKPTAAPVVVQPTAAELLARDKAAMVASPRLVYFDFDSFVIKPEFQSVIESHAAFLRAHKSSVQVVLEGHTDSIGTREYNLALGQKRAEAVRSMLASLGVSDAQVEAVSFGEEKPAAPGDDASSRAQNRRVEIRYR